MGSDESGDFFRLLCAELDGALEAAASSDAESSSAAPAVRGSRSSAPVRPEFPGDGSIFEALSRRQRRGGRGRRASAVAPPSPPALHRGVQAWCCPRLALHRPLHAHDGCVNAVAWSADGALLASGSDDTTVCIWDGEGHLALRSQLQTMHLANVFGVRFLDGQSLASCSLDGVVQLTDLVTGAAVHSWDSHRGAAQKIAALGEAAFLTCGEDGRVARHDRRTSEVRTLLDWGSRYASAGSHADLSARTALHSIACAEHMLLVGGEDAFVWLYDQRRIREPPANFYGGGPPPSPPVAVFRTTDTPWEGHVTSVALAPDGSRLLASWSGHHIFEFLVQDGIPWSWRGGPGPRSGAAARGEFGGHANLRTIKEVAYVGDGARVVASGSDDGRLFLWDTESCGLVGLCEDADSEVVNSIAPHPDHLLIATGGIDDDVKVWAPMAVSARRLQDEDVEAIIAGNERGNFSDPVDWP